MYILAFLWILSCPKIVTQPADPCSSLSRRLRGSNFVTKTAIHCCVDVNHELKLQGYSGVLVLIPITSHCKWTVSAADVLRIGTEETVAAVARTLICDTCVQCEVYRQPQTQYKGRCSLQRANAISSTLHMWSKILRSLRRWTLSGISFAVSPSI